MPLDQYIVANGRTLWQRMNTMATMTDWPDLIDLMNSFGTDTPIKVEPLSPTPEEAYNYVPLFEPLVNLRVPRDLEPKIYEYLVSIANSHNGTMTFIYNISGITSRHLKRGQRKKLEYRVVLREGATFWVDRTELMNYQPTRTMVSTFERARKKNKRITVWRD